MSSFDQRVRRSARRSRERWDYYSKLEDLLAVPELSEDERARQHEHLDGLKKLFERQDLQELREFLDDDVFNTRERLRSHLGMRRKDIDRKVLVKRLHMQTTNDTYHDYASEANSYRSRQRINALLELCHGDEELLLREYARSLQRYFPIDSYSSHFDWNPKLLERVVKAGRVVKVIKHHMKYRPQSATPEPV